MPSSVPPPDCGAIGLAPLTGGVSGAAVWQAVLDGERVVVKRVAARERVALHLLTGVPPLRGAVVPPLLAAGRDALGDWVVTPFYDGAVAGLLATPPLPVFETLGHLHASYRGHALPQELERLDEDFVVNALTRFAPDAWLVAAPLLPPRARRTALALTEAMLVDASFLRAGTELPATLLHGDVYGGNVLLPTGDRPVPVLLDWGCARVGPAMFDVAMTAPWNSEERRAHAEAWAEVAGGRPDQAEQRLAHAWARALTCLVFAPVVAARAARAPAGSAARAAQVDAPMHMLEAAAAAWADYARLR